ncbi:MAG: polysaccharide biosynthesis protein, partial [Planctomycetes bacterium]|nr:polysaccharide biosynthesis protein [Planctomycetota bacterium]
MLHPANNLKQFTLLVIDALITLISMYATMTLLQRSPDSDGLVVMVIIYIVRTYFFIRWGMYRAMLRFSGIHAIFTLALAMGIGSLAGSGCALFLNTANVGDLGRAFLVLELLLSTALLGGSRIAVRMYYATRRLKDAERVCIYGAGVLGEATLRNLQNDGYRVIGYVDDNHKLEGRIIHGRPVLGSPDNIADIIVKRQIDILVVAIMRLSQPRLKEVFHICMENQIRMKVVHGMGRMLDNSSQLSVDDLSMEDLLHRERRNLNRSVVEEMLRGRRVVVTGAGGSIGSEICRQVTAAHAKVIILIDHSEYNLYAIESELREQAPAGTEVIPVLLTLLDAAGLTAAFHQHKPEIVYHAAAYKHVPIVESNPLSSLQNNIQGAMNVIAAADEVGVRRFVTISTDKAVRPTNVMGASKRVIEMLI